MSSRYHNRQIRILKEIVLGIIFLLVFLSFARYVSRVYINIGMLMLVKRWPSCQVKFQSCVSFPSLPQGADSNIPLELRKWFDRAIFWQPGSKIANLHLAEILFSLGARDQVLDHIRPLEQYPSGNSQLVATGLRRERYEYYLLHALQLAHEGEWEAAVRDYRLGLAFGDEQTLPVDEDNYYRALAQVYQNRYLSNPEEAANALRAGKYYYETGALTEAVEWLNLFIHIPGTQPPEDFAWAYLLLGKIAEQNGDTSSALVNYRKAIRAAPQVRQAHLEYLRLLRALGQGEAVLQAEGDLETLGPEYFVGRQSNDLLDAHAAALPTGEVLAGYDLDPVGLENENLLELWLWWQSSSVKPSEGANWVRVRNYWVERRVVKNLYPNAGFEWGSDSEGIPFGQDRRLYQASPDNLKVVSVIRDGRETRVLAAYNDTNNPSEALASYPISVDPYKFYLMAGWLWDTTRGANLGRNCWWQVGGGPYYIAYENQPPLRPLQTWVHVADLSLLFPGEYPDQGCEVLLIHYMTQGQAMWDDILWAEIAAPSQ